MMLKLNQKTGDLSLQPSAAAGLIVLVFSFGVWMTDISVKLTSLGELKSKVARIENILTYHHIDIAKADPWPDLPATPYYPSLPSVPSVAAETVRRGQVFVTPP